MGFLTEPVIEGGEVGGHAVIGGRLGKGLARKKNFDVRASSAEGTLKKTLVMESATQRRRNRLDSKPMLGR